jgi:very-short-patch-repair endonuclease
VKRAKKKATRSKAELAFARAWRIRRMRVPSLPPAHEEYEFHPTRGWRFDFAWPELKLAVELDGRGKDGGMGAHQSITGQRRDHEKGNAAVLLGWRVLHFASMDKAQVVRWVNTVVEAMNAKG